MNWADNCRRSFRGLFLFLSPSARTNPYGAVFWNATHTISGGENPLHSFYAMIDTNHWTPPLLSSGESDQI
jgi:hypothetical protein